MGEEAQSDLFLQILRRFDREGILDHVMIIGSWCLPLYRAVLSEAKALPALRTLDVDFLIPDQSSIRREVDVPSVLEELGFVQTHYASSEWTVYDHPELRVEFLVPELGKGSDKARKIKKLHVNAQGLRYLNLLAGYPRKLSYAGLTVLVPEPAAFALQKLMISERRRGEKGQKDLESAIAVLDYVRTHPKEWKRMKEILKNIPKAWLKTITCLAKKRNLKIS